MARQGCSKPDPLSLEVAQRHASTLDAVNLPAGPVLDVGCGIGRIPIAGLPPALRIDWVSWPGEDCPQLIADAERLPLADQTFALVWSNLCLPWLPSPQEFFAEARRVMRDGGLLSVASLGPDTLAHIDARSPGEAPRTLGFLDMHDLADMVVKAGFAEPVALRENIEFVYSSPEAMLAELRGFGALAARGMETHLGQKATLQSLSAGEGEVRLGFEIIFLHAWAVAPRAAKIAAHSQGGDFWQEIKFQTTS